MMWTLKRAKVAYEQYQAARVASELNREPKPTTTYDRLERAAAALQAVTRTKSAPGSRAPKKDQ
jgi:hypothetical protein